MATSARYDSADALVVQRRECTPNTRKKVLLDLTSWKDNRDGEKVCWMNGMAGTGKTTIAYTLCSSLDSAHELGASFFCTRALPECRNVKLILPTVAYQLARFSGPFREALLRTLKRDPDVHTKVLHVQFRRMILEPLQAAKFSLPTEVLVVIDGLDECEDGNGVEQMLEVLIEHVTTLPIKFLISSRPEHHIRSRIGNSTSKRQLILHELGEKMVKADIETYLQAELACMSNRITQDQLEALVERAGALFIYAATVVRYIKGGNTVDRLAAVLKVSGAGSGSTKQTKEIDQLYEAVLTSALDNPNLEPLEKDKMELALHTVVCAQEPLTVDALAGLLGLTTEQVTDALKPFWSVLHLSESDSAHRVSILHASFPDYMLSSDRASRFACDAKVHNGRLAELCFIRIARNRLQFNVCNLESSYVFDEGVPDLDERVKRYISLDLLYACQYWADHLAQGGMTEGQTAMLHDFMSMRLLLWMEVLNLSKRINRAATSMEMAISWLKSTECSEKTVPLARDALRFVTMFSTSPVSQSTPHLYVSMLSSWPGHQPIYRCYAGRTTNLVRVKGIDTTERQLSLLSLVPAGSVIQRVAYSPNGAFFAAGTHDHKVLVWDAMSCRMIVEPMVGHADEIRAIAISPDGSQLCSGSHDKSLRIWDPQTGRLIAGPLEGHTHWVYSVNYSPDGRWIASGSGDGTIRIWDTYSWQAKSSPPNAHDEHVLSVVFSPNNAIVAAGYESTIRLWDPVSGRMVGESLEGHTGCVSTLAFMPNGKNLISGSYDNTIRVWDIHTGRIVIGPLQDHLLGVDSVAISPNGSLLASAATDNTIRIWDTNTWTTRSLFRHTGIARSVAFSPDGSRLVSGSSDQNIRVWEVTDISNKDTVETQTDGHDDLIRSVEFSPCGAYIVSGSDDRTVRMWDVQNGRSMGSPFKGHNGRVTRIGISADSDHIFSVSEDRMIHVWARQTGQQEYTIGPIETDGNYDPYYQQFWPAVLLFDNRRVICGSQSGRLYIWENEKHVQELREHSGAVKAIALSPDGQSFVSGDDEGNIIIWDAGSGERLLGPLEAHSACINSVAFSPNDSLVASGSDDNTVRLWSTHTGEPVGDAFLGHTSFVFSVAFSSRGKRLASGSQDMTVRIWDTTTGQPLAVFEGHTDLVFSVAFSPDGICIASGSEDTTIRMWNAPIPVQTTDDEGQKESSNEPANVTKVSTGSSWTMDKHGWVQDNDRRPLLWVPPDLRSVLLRPQNTILISREGNNELCFSDARIGDVWATCYEPL